MVRLFPQERGQRIIQHFVVASSLQMVERTVEQVPMRQILEQAVEVMNLAPQRRGQQQAVERPSEIIEVAVARLNECNDGPPSIWWMYKSPITETLVPLERTDPMVAWSEVAGVAGETMGVWLEGAVKSCNAGADSALKAHQVFFPRRAC